MSETVQDRPVSTKPAPPRSFNSKKSPSLNPDKAKSVFASKPSASTAPRSCSATPSTSKTPSSLQRTAMKRQASSKQLAPASDPSWIGRTASTVPGTFSLNKHGIYGEAVVVPLAALAEYPSTLSYVEGGRHLDAIPHRIRRPHHARDTSSKETSSSSPLPAAA